MADATARQKMDYWTGSSLFRSPWVAAPSSTKGRDGLGPLFNARSCNACHKDGGHGNMPGSGFGSVIRLSEYHVATQKYLPLKAYGEQLQTLSIDSITGGEEVPPEARVLINWIDTKQNFQGKTLVLKTPQLSFENLAYGEMSDRVKVSLRLAPPLFGLGLLQALSEQDILSREDINDRDHNGISGKANRVLDRSGGNTVVGRFGYKAEQANIRQQVAGAFHEDIGLSSWLYPTQNCTLVQKACNAMVTGNSATEQVEISREKLALVTHFSMLIKPPIAVIQHNKIKRHAGFAIFKKIGCSDCHIPFMKTAPHAMRSLHEKTFALFSDVLLHDMGKGLDDGRPVYEAGGSEWRTTPLWGLSRKLRKSVSLLHDGRAASITEAILWHGGEAQAAKMQYKQLPVLEQKAVVSFLRSL